MAGDVRVVHVVAKTHLDLGFTALASEVEAQYLTDFFPRAVAVADELRARGGPERLVWTTGSWILQRALAAEAAAEGATPLAEAVARGDLAWHAWPFTTHTELIDVPLAHAALAISQELDARFGRPTTTAAKMTDVPGHTRGLVPILAEAGVTFLHVGVNPAWPVPDVPPVFRWRSPPRPNGGAEVTVAYQSGGYGGEVVVPGCAEALAFLHAGDNLGPPTVDDVVAAHAELRDRFDGAEVRASTLDAFARALAASRAEADLPVVTAEIGDPWIFGCASDPQKLATYREVLRDRQRLVEEGLAESADLGPVDAPLLTLVEHTWGLDQKIALPDDRRWATADLAAVRAEPAGQRFEASWREQRGYADAAAAALAQVVSSVPEYHGPGGAIDPVAEHETERDWAMGPDGAPVPLPGDAPAAEVGGPFETGCWRVDLDPATGALRGLRHLASGIEVATPGLPLGLLTHQGFDERDYERFYAGLTPTDEDEWWARWDNTKPGIDACGARSGRWPARLERAWRWGPKGGAWTFVLARLTFDGSPSADLGAPRHIWLLWELSNQDTVGADGHLDARIECRLWWVERPPTRLPHALWWSFAPLVAEPERWTMDKLGQQVSPLDVVARGGRALHGVGEGGCSYAGPGQPVRLHTPDAPLVAPGSPRLLDADPALPDLAGGWHVLLADNCWGTNFPMWNEGGARFDVTLDLGSEALGR